MPPCETHAFLITSPLPAVQPLAASTYGEFNRLHLTLNSIPANSKNQSCTLAKKSGSRESQSPRNHRENTECPQKNRRRFTARWGLFAVRHRTSTFPTTRRPDSATFPKTPTHPTHETKQATQNSFPPLCMAPRHTVADLQHTSLHRLNHSLRTPHPNRYPCPFPRPPAARPTQTPS